MANFWVKFENKIDVNAYEPQFIRHKGRLYKLRVSGGAVCYFIVTDMTNAGKRGQTCLELYLENRNEEVHRFYWWNMINEQRDQFFELMQKRERAGIFEILTCVSYRDVESKRLFPLDLEILKPLKKSPMKWKIPDVIRALVNGQYKDLNNSGDYEMDTGRNRAVGNKLDSIKLAKKIMESPSGWWTSLNPQGVLSICCHTFDCNEFVPDVDNIKPHKTEVSENILEVSESKKELETIELEAQNTQIEKEFNNNNVIKFEVRQGDIAKAFEPNLSNLKEGAEIFYRGSWYPIKRVFEKSVMISNWLGIPECSQLVGVLEIENISANIRNFG